MTSYDSLSYLECIQIEKNYRMIHLIDQFFFYIYSKQFVDSVIHKFMQRPIQTQNSMFWLDSANGISLDFLFVGLYQDEKLLKRFSVSVLFHSETKCVEEHIVVRLTLSILTSSRR